jgi:CubicO group peptidase (beta-lactamase class C family)
VKREERQLHRRGILPSCLSGGKQLDAPAVLLRAYPPTVRRALTGLCLAFVVLAPAPASVQAAEPLEPDKVAAIQEYVERELDMLGVPGAGVVVVRQDEIVFAQGFGRADDNGREVTPQTPFELASVSKSLTAIAVMEQVEAGNLALDTAVRTYLPWFGEDQPALADVTVRDLLGHQSGWTEADGRRNLADTYDGEDAIERNVRRLAQTAPANARGTFEYSNANYDTLALLVETASGMAFADYIETEVFGPLDMSHSHATRGAAEADGLAQGYYPFLGIPIAYDAPNVPAGAGSGFLFASAEDLGHELILQLNEGRYGNEQVLSAESVRELQRPISRPDATSGYAGGLWTYPLWAAGALETDASAPNYSVPVMYEHGGDHVSAATGILFLPEERWGVVVLLNTNDESAPSRFHQLHYGIATILLGGEPAMTVAYEDALGQYGRTILVAVVALQVIGVVWALRRLRAWRRLPASRPRSGLAVAVQLVPALLLDIGVTVAIWWILADKAAGAPFEVVARYAPDIALLILVITVLGVGWGLLRTFLSIRALRMPAPVTSV